MKRQTIGATIAALAVLLAACGGSGSSSGSDDPSPSSSGQVCGTDSGTGCAAESERVDLAAPSFSNPTNVTNPLFPVSQQHSVLLLGVVEGEPFRTEVTLLPETRVIDWNGRQVETLISQYVAFLDGRIEEVALDYYAQADDGSVWYFGEDVFNYADGVVADTEGTWLAGKDGPAAMIMPANPQVGDVYRTENAPGFAFEEVTVTSNDKTVDGPQGPLAGALIVRELHMDETTEDKTFAPGYGEFYTAGGGDIEALALAVPTDALPGAPPAELETLFTGATDIVDTAETGDWDAASASLVAMTMAWEAFRVGGTPPLLETEMSAALAALTEAVDARDHAEARQAALNVARLALDFQLRHRTPADIDLARFDLWARQVLIDAAANDSDSISGDVITLKLVRNRIAHTLDSADVGRIDAQLDQLQTAVDDDDVAAAATVAEQLREIVAGLQPAP